MVLSGGCLRAQALKWTVPSSVPALSKFLNLSEPQLPPLHLEVQWSLLERPVSGFIKPSAWLAAASHQMQALAVTVAFPALLVDSFQPNKECHIPLRGSRKTDGHL